MFSLFACSISEKTAYSPSNSYYEKTSHSSYSKQKSYTKNSYKNKWIYYQDDEVTEYRCPHCGSHDVMEVVTTRGFSARKALVGNILFGPIGTLAGASGQNKIQINLKCRRCGKAYKY